MSFMISNENVSGRQTMTVGFTRGSSTPSQSYTADQATGYWTVWETKVLMFVATATSAEVSFSVTDQQNDMGLDNVQVTNK